MYLLIISSLLTNVLFIILFGRFIGNLGTIVLTTFSFVVSLISVLLAYYEVVLCNINCNLKLFN